MNVDGVGKADGTAGQDRPWHAESEHHQDPGPFGRRDLLILLALIVPVLIVFADPLFTGRVFYYRDVARFFQPNMHYAAERLREGHLPLWNPYCFCGHPFLASWYPGVLYPASAITVFFPLPHSLTAFLLVHSYLALAAMYLFVRHLGCSRPAAAIGALTFGLSGFALSVVDYPNSLAGLAWAPVVVLLVHRAVCRPGLGRTAAAAVVIAVQVLAGGPEMVYCTGLVAGLFGLAKLISDRRFEAGRRLWRRRAAVLVACFGLGALLAAAQLVPFAEVLFHSARGRGYGLVAGSASAVPPRDLLRFLAPDLWTWSRPTGLAWSTQQWLKSFYLGLVPLVLAGIALVQVRERRTWFFAGLAAAGMVLACGERTPFWVLAYYGLPGIAAMRYPVKFMMIPTFSLALLAGIGANWLLLAEARRRRRTLLAAALAVLVAIGGTGFVIRALDRAWQTGRRGPRIEEHETVRAEVYRNSRQSLLRTGMVLGAVLVCLVGLAAVGGRFPEENRGHKSWVCVPRFPPSLSPRGRGGRAAVWLCRAPALALGLLLVADTVVYHRRQVMTAHPKVYRIRPRSLDLIDRLPRPSRIFFEPALLKWLDGSPPSAAGEGDPLALVREIHIRNLPMLHHVQSARGFVPVRPRRFDRLYRALNRRYEGRSRPIVDFLNARLLIHAPNMEIDPTRDAIRFDVNPDVLPRATIVRRRTERVFDDDDALADWLTGRDFNPRDEVHLDREPTPPTLHVGEAASEDRVEIVLYEPERVVMRVESTAPGYLVVSDQFFPGWRATVGGEPAEIVRANLCFRAVTVPAGVFTVTMEYRPWTLTLGLVLSAATAVLLAAAVVLARIRRRRRVVGR